MVLSPRRRRGGPLEEADAASVAPIQFQLQTSKAHVVTDDGRQLDGQGYVICDARTGSPLGDDDFFFRIGGGIVTDLIGAEAHLAELQNTAFRPGRALTLVRPPMLQSGEPPVVEVFDLTKTNLVGQLPHETADAVAFCLWEWRDSDGQRVGLRLLLAPGWTVEELPTA